MSDDSWKSLRSAQERLKWARKRAGFASARAAAASLAIKEGTYRTYERSAEKGRASNFSHDQATQFARRFKVSWEWLLRGQGTPELTSGSLAARDPLLDRMEALVNRLAEDDREGALDVMEAYVVASQRRKRP